MAYDKAWLLAEASARVEELQAKREALIGRIERETDPEKRNALDDELEAVSKQVLDAQDAEQAIADER